MKTIKIILAATVILIASNLKAQDLSSQAPPLKIKEYGIGLSNFNSFSLQYRWGNEKRLFRINATIGGSIAKGDGSNNISNFSGNTGISSLNSNNTKTSSPLNFNTGLSFSMLNIKYVADKFGIMYGPLAGINYSTISTQTTVTSTNSGNVNEINLIKNHTETLQPYIGFILGAVYKIGESFLVYIEIAPNIYYARNNTTINNSTNYIISNNTNASNAKNSNNTFGIANLSNSGAMLTFVYRITK